MPGSVDTAQVSRKGERRANEDYADFTDVGGCTCWVLGDGLGGHRGGALAARTAVEAAIASFRESPGATPEAVGTHIARAHAAVQARQRETPELADMRSTIVLLVCDGKRAVWGHVGDSRLYHVRNGCVAARTRDHSVSQALVDAGEIDPRAHGQHEDRSRLLQALGKEAGVEAAIVPVQDLCRDDGFLLCSDGFWEELSELDVEIDFAGSEDARSWLDRLEARILQRAGDPTDNCSAIAIRLTAAALPAAAPHDPGRPREGGAPGRRRRPDAGEGGRLRPDPGLAASGPVTRDSRLRAAAIIVAIALAAAGLGAWRLGLLPGFVAWWKGTDVSPVPPLAAPADAGPSLPGARSDESALPSSPAGSSAPAGSAPNAPANPRGPSDVGPGQVYRPAAGRAYGSLAGAVGDAASGETIWLGAGRFREGGLTIDKVVSIQGAGRDRTTIDVSGDRGVTITADDGAIEDVSICCASSDVLEVAGRFAGRLTRIRIDRGGGFGLVLRDRARPVLADVEYAGNKSGNMKTTDAAQPAR
jgi:serine/threonine protein phosphatase PrpC